MIDQVDAYPIPEDETAMESLNLEGQAFIPPERFVGLVTDIAILIITEVAQELRDIPVIAMVIVRRQLPGLGLHIREFERLRGGRRAYFRGRFRRLRRRGRRDLARRSLRGAGGQETHEKQSQQIGSSHNDNVL